MTPHVAIALLALGTAVTTNLSVAAPPLPIFDAHVHYSHDSVAMTPPETVVKLMRQAGLKGALVSSSDDKGTQLLANLAPDLIIPGLRPYRRRGELSTWFKDPAALAYVEERLAKHRYATIGEFHLYGDNADLPIPRRIVDLATQHNLVLHAHSDADAIARLFAHNSKVKILWAHSGFDSPEKVAQTLARFPNLWADLAFRSDMGDGHGVDPAWRKVFDSYPNRLMVGTDTFTPERIYYVPEHAAESRAWLAGLPTAQAEKIAWRNAYELLMPIWQKNRKSGTDKDKTSAVDAADVALPCQALTPATANTDRVVMAGQRARVMLQATQAIRVSQPFSVNIALCDLPPSDRLLSLNVDATMPAHGHGMNYQPKPRRVNHNTDQRARSATSSNTGQSADASPAGHPQSAHFQLDGMVLHMPGRWRWQVKVTTASGSEMLTSDFVVR